MLQVRRHNCLSQRLVETLPAVNREQWTLMPWRNLAQLPDQHLKAIYVYLRSRPPVSHKVDVHPVIIAQR